MSIALKAILAAMASERELIANGYSQIAAASPISAVGTLSVPTANTNCMVDCINRIKDPQGRGGLTGWRTSAASPVLVLGNRYDSSVVYGVGATVTYGLNSYVSLQSANSANQPDVSFEWWQNTGPSSALNPPAGWEPGASDASYVAYGAAVNGWLQVSVDPTIDTFSQGQEFWAYAFVLCGSAATVEAIGSSGTVYGTQQLPASNGWVLIALQGTTAKIESVAVRLTRTGASVLPGATALGMTGVTFVTEKDPGGPFSGNYDDEPAFAYRWEATVSSGARNQSRTIRYGQQFDLVALDEQQSGVSLAPLGLTVEQRALFLRQRFLARHQPGAAVFKQLIVELLQTEDPSVDQSLVQVQVNPTSFARDGLPPRSFAVSMAYTPSGALAARLQQQVEQTAPLHLAFQGISYGAFQAGVNTAGQPV
jgi:hypothetical protein